MKSIIKLSYRNLTIGIIALILLSLYSCKNDFLDAKPNKSLLVPATLNDFQALLDNAYNVMNRTPYLGEVAGDDFIIPENTLHSYSEIVQRCYRWEKEIFLGRSTADWDTPYQQIFYANVVLEGLDKYSLKEEKVRNIKGAALFYRGWALYHVAQLFASPYNENDVETQMGIPVRTSSDLGQNSERKKLKDTYDQVLFDLESAIPLLPVESKIITRPSRAAAYAFMARLHLTLGNFEKVKLYSDSTLAISNELLDYNKLDSNRIFPMPNLYLASDTNPEVIFLTILNPNSFLIGSSNTLVSPQLLETYSPFDLRRSLFFNKTSRFRGTYIGMDLFQFSGLSVSEVYLSRAEANARLGNIEDANNDLNTLLKKRYSTLNYIMIRISDRDELLKMILQERRKELVGRGIRWTDLRRLNQENSLAVTLKRSLNGNEYALPPGDRRYTFPIPDSEIIINNMPQNER